MGVNPPHLNPIPWGERRLGSLPQLLMPNVLKYAPGADTQVRPYLDMITTVTVGIPA
jgi:hypothetical protein